MAPGDPAVPPPKPPAYTTAGPARFLRCAAPHRPPNPGTIPPSCRAAGYAASRRQIAAAPATATNTRIESRPHVQHTTAELLADGHCARFPAMTPNPTPSPAERCVLPECRQTPPDSA